MSRTTYYTSQKRKILKDLQKFLKPLQPEFITRYGETEIDTIFHDIQTEYEKLIPQFPYIGGKENSYTGSLMQCCYGLAIYRALQAKGITPEEVGELMHLGVLKKMGWIPMFIRRLMGKMMFSKKRLQKMIARGKASQQRQYPENWVWEFLEGDGKTYDIGANYTECGIVKFMKRQGAEELTPYFCNLDYTMFGLFGIELQRTKTLGWGCDCCNFRIILDGNPPPAWPPRFVERDCGQ